MNTKELTITQGIAGIEITVLSVDTSGRIVVPTDYITSSALVGCLRHGGYVLPSCLMELECHHLGVGTRTLLDVVGYLERHGFIVRRNSLIELASDVVFG